MDNYNGWSNYNTWNVAFWLGNDYGLYQTAKRSYGYRNFLMQMNYELGDTTPDDVDWFSTDIDVEELDEFIKGL